MQRKPTWNVYTILWSTFQINRLNHLILRLLWMSCWLFPYSCQLFGSWHRDKPHPFIALYDRRPHLARLNGRDKSEMMMISLCTGYKKVEPEGAQAIQRDHEVWPHPHSGVLPKKINTTWITQQPAGMNCLISEAKMNKVSTKVWCHMVIGHRDRVILW